jgi:hypothetical protein
LDQGQTGTCVGNAFAHRRADSPVPIPGIDEGYARQLYFDASGDASYQEGTSGIEACRVLATRGSITQYHWITTPEELRNAVLVLGTICVGTYWYNSMFSPKVAYGTQRAYMKVDRQSGLAGGHEYVINGINLAPASGPPFYRMKNSWGLAWPGSENPGKTVLGAGTARFACTDIEELIFSEDGDAVLITEAS